MAEIIVIFLAMVVVFIVLFWLRKTLFFVGFFFRLFMILLLVGIVGSVLFGYAVVKDADNFRNNFGNSTSMFIVQSPANGTDTGAFLSGLTINPGRGEFNPMTKDELASVEKLHAAGQINTLVPEYYKVFIIDLDSFDDIELYNISDKNIVLTSAEIKRVMLSDDARDTVAAIIAEKNNISESVVLAQLTATDEDIKAYILSYYLSSTFNPDNAAEFLLQFKKNNVKVYTETALFKAIRITPSKLITSVA